VPGDARDVEVLAELLERRPAAYVDDHDSAPTSRPSTRAAFL
jgi:hypothetical protein